MEILVHLPSTVSAEDSLPGLYAFTDCEVSLAPNACIIKDNHPQFLSVNDLVKSAADLTREILRRELEIKLGELQEKWHFASLEKIFIEKRIYRDIEKEETWEGVIAAVDKGLKLTPSLCGVPLHRRISSACLKSRSSGYRSTILPG